LSPGCQGEQTVLYLEIARTSLVHPFFKHIVRMAAVIPPLFPIANLVHAIAEASLLILEDLQHVEEVKQIGGLQPGRSANKNRFFQAAYNCLLFWKQLCVEQN
jgi:hypothetical protein